MQFPFLPAKRHFALAATVALMTGLPRWARAVQPAAASRSPLQARERLRRRPLDSNNPVTPVQARERLAAKADPVLAAMLSAWADAPAQLGQRTIIHLDLRTGGPLAVEPDGLPWIPGTGINNRLTKTDLAAELLQATTEGAGDPRDANGVNNAVLERIARRFMAAHKAWFPVPQSQLVSRPVPAAPGDAVRHVLFAQVVEGVPVEGALLVFHVGHGNLLSFGGQFLSPVAESSAPKLAPQDAVGATLGYAAVVEPAVTLVAKPALNFVVMDDGGGAVGAGYRHRLVYTLAFRKAGEPGTWQSEVDAQTGEILSFKDINDYGTIIGGVQPLSNDGICPTGCEQPNYPMPFADAGGGVYTDTGGNYAAPGTGTTALNGRYVRSLNTGFCNGAINETAVAGVTNLGTSGGTDCTVPAGHSAGDTHAARDAFYNVNKLKEEVRGWLPTWTFNNNQVTVNVNLNQTCNAYWNGVSLNMFKSSATCRNTGEIAMIFDHEIGHGYDSNDLTGYSRPSEAYADNVASIHHHDSCIGRGFFVSGFCYGYGNACTTCTGVRDSDWTKFTTRAPKTVTRPTGTAACPAGSDICNWETHCAAYPITAAFWDAATIDLPHNPIPAGGGAACPAATNPTTPSQAWTLLSKLWWKSVNTIGDQYACNTTGTAGCPATADFHNLKVQDDDDGNLANGTPHAAELQCAFGRAQTGCTTDNNVDFTICPALLSPTLTLTPGNNQITLNWTAVTNATQYRVFRNEEGCGAGYSLITTINAPTLTYTDVNLLNGRTYYYQVQPVGGATNQCDGQPSACQSAAPSTCSPPPAPTGLTGTPTCAGIDLSWTASAGATSYNILRGSTCAGVVQIATGVTGTTYSDATAVPGTSYFYAVQAVGCGSSPNSACSASVTTNGVSAPTAVTASSNSCANVSVSWTNGAGSTSTNLLRYNGACPSAAGLVTNTGVTSPFTDATAAAGSSYCYVARAVKAACTADAAGVTGTRLATPGAPAAPTATGTCAGIDLTFAAPPVSTTYTILRSATCGGAATTVATGVSGTSYSDTTATPGTTYVYTLQAVNTCGSSPVGACSGGAARLVPPSPTVTGPTSGCGSVALSTQSYTAYQWNLGGTPIGGATAQNYAATATGTYSVTATGANGCSATSPGYAVTVTPGSQTFHFQVQNTFVAGYKDMQNATGFEAAVQQQATANITAAGEYQIGSVPLQWISPAYAKNTDLASAPWTFDVYGLTTNSGAAGQLYAKVYRYNAGTPVLLFTTGYASPDISTASSQTRFTWNHTPAAGTVLATGDRLIAQVWVHATAGTPGGSSTATATAEADPAGSTVTGTFVQTQVCDTTGTESIQLNGNNNNGLEHTWTFTVPAGAPAPVFQFVGYHTGGAATPPALQWGTNLAGPWTAMFNVTNTASPGCAAPQTFTLPGGTSGTVYIRAFQAANAASSLVVDSLAIVKGSGAPFFTLNYDFASADTLVTAADCAGAVSPGEVSGTAPTAMTARKGAGAGTVVLNFEDRAGATGYNVYEGNMPFAPATPYTHGGAAGNVCAVATTLAAGRRTTPAAGLGTAGSHYYLVTAYNTLEGPSGYNSAAVEIPPAQSTCAP